MEEDTIWGIHPLSAQRYKASSNLVFLPPLLTNLPSTQKREVNLNLLVPTIFMVQSLRNYYHYKAKNVLNVRNWADA